LSFQIPRAIEGDEKQRDVSSDGIPIYIYISECEESEESEEMHLVISISSLAKWIMESE